MRRMRGAAVAAGLACGAAGMAIAQDRPVYVLVNEAMGVPVFAGDIADRPYRISGAVTAGVRKGTMFSKPPSEAKVFRELWERAKKMGADAVIHARYGHAHVTALSWGQIDATGTAIRFETAAGG